MRETAELTFSTTLGGTRVVRIPEPMPNVTANFLDTAVTGIIAANPFDETVGELVGLKRAERVTVNRIPLI